MLIGLDRRPSFRRFVNRTFLSPSFERHTATMHNFYTLFSIRSTKRPNESARVLSFRPGVCVYVSRRGISEDDAARNYAAVPLV